MKYVCFKLSMPGCPSWNGKWSGEGSFYAIVVKFPEVQKEKFDKVMKESYYSYSWPDGWRAAIDVTEVDAKQARQIKKNSRGFCGYDWMVDSIIKDGVIKT